MKANKANVVRALSLVGALASLAYACVIYPTSLLLPASPDAGPVDNCAHAALPGALLDGSVPPDLPDAASLSLVFAMSDLRVDTSDTVHASGLGPVQAFDLDGVCACDGIVACQGGLGAQCNPGGANNAFGPLVNKLFTDTDDNYWIKVGQDTSLLTVDGYNGTPNDSQVSVRYYASLGLRGYVLPEAGVPSAPKFDGTDEWTVEPGSTVLGDAGIGRACDPQGASILPCPALAGNQDVNAFVRDGVVYFRPIGPLRFELPIDVQRELFVQTSDVIGFAKIDRSDRGIWRLTSGTLTGRIPLDTLLLSMAQAPNLLAGAPAPSRKPAVCEDQGTWNLLRDFVCAQRDLSASPANDKNPSVPCNAMSFSARFQAVTAKIGRVYQPKRPDTCPAGFVPGTCPQ